jgi:hypothetical protein
VFCPLRTEGTAELVLQIGESRLVVDCRLKAVKFVGHVRIRLAPVAAIVSCAANEILRFPQKSGHPFLGLRERQYGPRTASARKQNTQTLH